jgi:signal transduction histidine kinase
MGDRYASAIAAQPGPTMRSSFFFYARLVFAWAFLLVFALAFWSTFTRRGQGGIFLVWVIVMIFVVTSAISHVRRVRLINGSANGGTLANRQRRQIEMPVDAGRAFDILDAAIRELPNVEDVESARDSLQIRAKVRRVYSYGGAVPLLQRMIGWFGAERNQIFATVMPHPDTGTVNLVCEPEGGAWRDWFTVDNGTNLENAEAISRAVSRRITEVRRGEQESTKETQTEKELAIAKLQLLHAQVEPHFLYNTLGSAKYLVHSDPAGAERIIDNLILYLRHSLPRLENSLTTLGDEVERVRAYLDIMQIRMGARLKTELNVPDALKSVAFPTMMLQTLVENSIKHGLEPKSGGGTIWVLATPKEDRVAVTVADDGNGLGTETVGSGIGLRNVRERLRLAYGDDAAFDLAANFPAGVAATITVPMSGPKHARHD